MRTRQITFLSCMVLFSILSFNACANTAEINVDEKATNSDKVPLNDLQRFTTVMDNIKNYYVKPIDDSTLFENAIRGMLTGLDPHSSYLDTEEFADLKQTTTGKFGGLGIEVSPEEGLIRIISPIDDTPAQRAGIKAGDLIVRLNDTPVKGLSLKEAIDMMRGEKGSLITLTVIREGEPKPLIIPIHRDIINIQSVKSKTLEDNYGYIRVSQFQSNSGDDLIRAIQTLKKANGGKLKGLILDLRNNPGGILESSVQISDAFLDRDKLKYDAVIVYAKGRLSGSQIKEKAHPGDLLNGAPMVVLVNYGSASASEIVAGALQDHQRAVIMGTQTFGKGSVQTVIPLKDKRGLKLTTALYYTPAGRSIQAVGIKPDIWVENMQIPKEQADELSGLYVRESQLQGHFANGTPKTTDVTAPTNNGTGTPSTPTKKSGGDKTSGNKTEKTELPLVNTDYQLYEALNVLKALSLVNQQRG
jgi:carboxyl-terminal processing protease